MSNLLFSLTKKDFEVVFYASHVGPGGQKINRTSSACRISHRASGAVGDSKTHRSQEQNKKEAFRRLVESKKFQIWLKMEIAARLEGFRSIEEKVAQAVEPRNLRIEVFQDGDWKPETPNRDSNLE